MASEKKDFSNSGLDLDSKEELAQGYRYALNINIGTSDEDNLGAVENAQGNRLITTELPTGDLKVIGTFADVVGSSIIYFVFSSTNNHVILRFFIRDDSITELARGESLDFQEGSLINGVDLDQHILIWTDGVTHQKKLNIDKGFVENNLTIKLYFEYLPAISTDFTLSIEPPGGPNLVNTIVFTVPGPSPATLDELVAGVTAGINALPQSPASFSAEDAGGHVLLTMNVTGYYDIVFSASVGSNALAVYDNTYQQPLLPSYIDLLRSPPRFPPVASFVDNGSYIEGNNVQHKIFEFRTRYIFDDGEISVLSPISKLPLFSKYPFAPDNNYSISVDYLDEKLSSPAELNIIVGVDLVMREENSGTWKKVKSIRIDEVIGTKGKFTFLNDEEYAAISVDDADKNFDSLPLLSNALSFMNDRLFLDAKLEGYDTVLTNVEITLNVLNDVIFSNVDDTGSFVKRPGNYKYGLVYFDRGLRSNTVCTDQSMEIRMPGYAEDLSQISYVEAGSPDRRYGVIEVNWKIKHLPPVWATHYGWMRTLDSIHNDYRQTTVKGGVRYLAADRSTVEPAASASFVELVFNQWFEFNNTFPAAVAGWNFVEGDKMRILRDGTTSPDAGGVWLSEVVVTNVVGNNGSSKLVMEVTPLMQSLPDIEENFFVEFYRPGKEVENEIYYEIGEFFEIINPHLSTRHHQGQFSNQNPSNPINSPATGTFTEGDNYRIIGRDWGTPDVGSVPNRIIDNPNADERYKEVMNSYNKGRINVYAPEIGQASRGSSIRYSDKRFADTNINGYSTFKSANIYTELDRSHGDAMVLSRVENILLLVLTREAVTLFINESIYVDTSGNPTVSVSDKVIGNDRALRGAYGTENAESFDLHKSNARWFCTNLGEFVRYGGDGITSLTKDFVSNHFKKKAFNIRKYGGNVITTFDQFHTRVIVAFSEIKDGETVIDPASTISFSEKDIQAGGKRWDSFWSYLPEHMSKVDTKMVSFKDGQLWLHESITMNNFYGVQYLSQIEPIFNGEPGVKKVFQSLSQESSTLWVATKLSTTQGQLSSLKSTDYEKKEDIFEASILRDENTPNLANPITQGDVMRSTSIKILLENSDTEKSVLLFAEVEWKPSSLNS